MSTPPGVAELDFHDRIQIALRKAWPTADTASQCRKLREALLEAGAHPHHAAQLTIQRWITGRGMPPPECLAIFAETLGVTYRWLRDGEGALAGSPGAATRARQERAPAARRPRQPGTKPQKPVPPEPPLPTAEEVEVSIPTAEDVYASSTRVISDYLKVSVSTEAIEAILEHERENPDPKFEGGRKTILRDAERRLSALAGSE